MVKILTFSALYVTIKMWKFRKIKCTYNERDIRIRGKSRRFERIVSQTDWYVAVSDGRVKRR
jgi:hypothetical protein